jgi:two-component system sensor histidine kinase BarA
MTLSLASQLERPPWLKRLGVRLAALLALGAVISALLAMSAMLAMAWFFAERDAFEEAHQVARGVAFALQAPVSFADSAGIHDAVAVLQARPQIRGAWVHDQTGRLLHGVGPSTLEPGPGDAGSLAQGWLQVGTPIVAGTAGDTVGRLTLQVSLEEVQRKLRWQGLAAAGASLVAALLALAVSQRLARGISVPVAQLAATAGKITREQNYQLRLPARGQDEVGMAVNAFNQMLDEIEQRGTTLVNMNRQLHQQAEVAQAAQAQAESASLAKTRFLANMSHELRSPLNGVIGAAQLLQAQGGQAARRAELVEIIRTSGTNLLGLIEQVLDLARIEAGALELQPQDFNLLECVEAAVVSSSALAAKKGLRLSCHVDPDLALWRHGDDTRLRQLVLNLLGNAIKFTAQGDVSVDVQAVKGSADRLQIAVRDSGIGISPAALATVFEPFQQADASTTRRYGGSGLGLSICRDLARLMGGDVTAQSIPGVGSCFTIEVPLPTALNAGQQAQPLGFRVAWCEPHEPSAKALAALLQRLGCDAQRCHDLAELQAFMAIDDSLGRPPWFMVALDADPGRALLDAAWPGLVPGHVLPIDGAAEVRQAHVLEASGLPRALSRPVLRAALVSRLASARTVEAPALQTQPAPLPAQTAARVLLVEDDAINQTVVKSMLEYAGFGCTVAGNGVSALQLLERTPFDLVLMDWQMPHMDGMEATRRLRAGQAGELNRTVPVVALTANAFAEDRSACLAAGMNDFVTKPVLAAHLVAVAERWAFHDRVPDSRPHRLDETVHRESKEDIAPVYDPSVLAKLPMVADGSDPDYPQRLLGLFERTAATTLAAIEQGLRAGDLKGVQRGVHTLKSSAAQVGALALSGEAARIETGLRQGELALADLPQKLERLMVAKRELAEAVAGYKPG